MHERGAVRTALVWRRTFIGRLKAAVQRGVDLPSGASRSIPIPTSTDRLAVDVDRLVAVGREHLSKLGAVGVTAEMLKRGGELAESVRAADDLQELGRGSHVPQAVRRMWELAATVWSAVKQLKHIARSVHAGDRSKASLFNMQLLHRGHGSSSGDPSPPAESKSA